MVRPGPYMLEVVLFVSVTMENETLEGSWLSRCPRLASAVAVDAFESCRRWAINTSVDHAGDSRPGERVREQDIALVHSTIYIVQSKLSSFDAVHNLSEYTCICQYRHLSSIPIVH
jgi:hypothetical protein